MSFAMGGNSVYKLCRHMNVRELTITLIGHAIGEMFGPLSLPPDEYLHVPECRKIDVGSVFGGNECAAALITAAVSET